MKKSDKPTVFHGIDLSLSCTAIVTLNQHGEIISKKTGIGHSLKRGAPWWLRYDRVVGIANTLKKHIESHSGTRVIVFEGPSLGSRGAQLFFIGALHNMLFKLLSEITYLEAVEVPPTNLKKFVTGKGNAKKELMAAHTQKRWDKIFKDNNLTDAYGLCQIGRALYGFLKMPQVNMNALEKVLRHVKN